MEQKVVKGTVEPDIRTKINEIWVEEEDKPEVKEVKKVEEIKKNEEVVKDTKKNEEDVKNEAKSKKDKLAEALGLAKEKKQEVVDPTKVSEEETKKVLERNLILEREISKRDEIEAFKDIISLMDDIEGPLVVDGVSELISSEADYKLYDGLDPKEKAKKIINEVRGKLVDNIINAKEKKKAEMTEADKVLKQVITGPEAPSKSTNNKKENEIEELASKSREGDMNAQKEYINKLFD